MRATAGQVLLGVLLAGLLAACEDEPRATPEQIRPIRAFTITEAAGGQVRRFSGVIEAIDSSNLSFEIPGAVQRVLVQQGDAVKQGQVLASLDEEPYRLNVQAAQADLQRARAFLAQARADYERNTRLLEQRAVARVQFEVAQRDFLSAQSQIDLAVAKLNLAQRDLRNTTLVAPFDGTIAQRLVDPFVQVQAGLVMFRIDAKGGLQASIGVPETTIAQISPGMSTAVTLPQSGVPIEARISEIGSAAGAGNVFPVKATLLAPPPTVRPGMTAEVTLMVGGSLEARYFIPLSAIAAGDSPGEGFVFVYDPITSTVRRTLVRSPGPLAQNMVAVTGLNVGDIVANAGVSFLVEGQRVRLMQPAAESPRS